MPKKTPVRTGKGKGLKRKLGPFPVYVWAIAVVVIVAGYLYYRNRQQGGTVLAAGSQNQSVIPIAIPSGGQSGASSGGGNVGQDTTGNSVTYPTDYVTNTDFQSGIEDLKSGVAANIAAITFPQPDVNITVPPAQVVVQTQQTKTAAKKAVVNTPKRYYTRKTQVHLKAGQTLHFTKGKGYYAG